jgi:hypothetical protein
LKTNFESITSDPPLKERGSVKLGRKGNERRIGVGTWKVEEKISGS